MVTVLSVIPCPGLCHWIYSIPLDDGSVLMVMIGPDGSTVDIIG